MKTLKVLRLLLSYPTQMHIDALPECRETLQQEAWLSDATLAALDAWTREMEEGDLLDLQEEYVSLFDRTPSLSLHLFEHVHGDSRDRGPAMVDLSNLYKEAGLAIATEETPDYLPMFMEYLSTQKPENIREHLGSAINIIVAVGERLKKRGTGYAIIFDALAETAERNPDPKAVAAALKEASGAEYSPEELDREWEEQFAFDDHMSGNTGQSGGCPKAEDMLTRMEGKINREGIEK